MRSANPHAECTAVPRLDDLPADAAALLDHASFLFETRAWWEATVDAALPVDASPCFLLVRLGVRPAALFPLLHYRTGSGPDGAGLGSLTTPYTCLYAPLARDLEAAGTEAVMRAFTRFARGAS